MAASVAVAPGSDAKYEISIPAGALIPGATALTPMFGSFQRLEQFLLADEDNSSYVEVRGGPLVFRFVNRFRSWTNAVQRWTATVFYFG